MIMMMMIDDMERISRFIRHGVPFDSQNVIWSDFGVLRSHQGVRKRRLQKVKQFCTLVHFWRFWEQKWALACTRRMLESSHSHIRSRNDGALDEISRLPWLRLRMPKWRSHCKNNGFWTISIILLRDRSEKLVANLHCVRKSEQKHSSRLGFRAPRGTISH